MKRSAGDAIDSRVALAESLKTYAEFRAIWEQTAVPRALSLAVLGYRIDNNLTQTALARKIGISQPAVARLEIGEHMPTIETLTKLSNALGLGFRIEIRPRSDVVTGQVRMVDLPTDIEADINFQLEDEQLQSAAD